jgi:regulator of protease activity HflC (stomatin/prohibitin superfamily)
MQGLEWALGIAAVVAVIFLWQALKIVQQYERGVVLRLGQLRGGREPGLRWIWPGVDRMYKVNLRLRTMDVPKQVIFTRDNVPVRVNAVVFFRVQHADMAVIKVDNYAQVTSQKAQTTLRSVLGACELDDLLAKRERINEQLREILDQVTDEWGVQVTSVEIKDVELPEEMQRAMARQAEAERERRAKVIHAEGEYQASEQLSRAAAVMEQSPITLQLRFLQTLTEIAAEQNSTTVFPVPLEL